MTSGDSLGNHAQEASEVRHSIQRVSGVLAVVLTADVERVYVDPVETSHVHHAPVRSVFPRPGCDAPDATHFTERVVNHLLAELIVGEELGSLGDSRSR